MRRIAAVLAVAAVLLAACRNTPPARREAAGAPAAPVPPVADVSPAPPAAAGPDASAAATPPAEPPPPPLEAAPITAIVGGTVWDGTGRAPIPDAVVVLERDRIRAVWPRDSIAIPAGAKVVDAAGLWVVPGLVDAHVHFFQSAGLYTRPDIIDLGAVRPYPDEVDAIRAKLDDTFRRYLASGVTGVVDMGGPMWNFEVRDRAAATSLAPHVAVAGPLISTVSRPALDLGDPPIIRAESPDDVRRLAEAQIARKTDLLKVWFVVAEDRTLEEGAALCRAAAEAAHDAGLRLAVHATELAAAHAALDAGADILVHSVGDEPLDDAFLEKLEARDVIYIPNLVVLEGYAGVLGRRPRRLPVETRWGDPDAIRSWSEMPAQQGEAAERTANRLARFAAATPVQRDNLRRVLEADVRIAAGTDAGNIGTLHGPSLHRELEMMAEAGMSPVEVLAAATRTAAYVASPTPDFGTLEPGRAGDLLILEADPLADVRNLRRIRWVVRGGIVARPDEIHDPNAEAVVQDQVDAYNARDIEAFAATYASDVTVSRLPSGEVFVRGVDQLRQTYEKLFADSPDLRCRVLQRTVDGPTVVDHELVTGIPDRPYLHAVAVYHVEDGRIRSVTLARSD